MTENALARETSPYLLQHKDNPVHWQAWGDEALARARSENKPILLSIGYAACHWCHVMAHESFEDPDIARVMNDLYVNIKVDREERPDLDAIYQSALAMLGEHGGWPLTMFLTPDGAPFWGGTYFPPTPHYGRPGFPQVLQGIHDAYRNQGDKVEQNVAALTAALRRRPEPSTGDLPGLDTLDHFAQQLVPLIDLELGGFKQPPKFPHVPAFDFLWRAYRRSGDARCREAVLITCERMAEGGIYDHIGGGFARYSTDAEWLVPHFEKMLYDNAQLIDLLTTVWIDTGRPLFARRIEETVDWVLREMIAEGGGFASTLDADSEGEEGKFYVWTEQEIDSALGDRARVFKAAYDVTPTGNWEGKTILNRSRGRASSDAEDAELATARQTLLDIRSRRVWPGWDDKVLADWNGLMIAALADAGGTFGKESWIAAAERAFAFVASEMADGDRLYHSHRQGQPRHAGMLDDYAAMSRAALYLHQATGDETKLDAAKAWLAVLDSHFADLESGGYYMTADDAENLITRPRSANDSATPAGNGLVLEVLVRLYHLTGDETWRSRSEALVAAFSADIERNALGPMTLLNNWSFFLEGHQVVVFGQPGDPATERMVRVVRESGIGRLSLQVLSSGEGLPETHPAAGKGPVDGQPAAFVCTGMTCSLPVTDPQALRDLLRGAPAS